VSKSVVFSVWFETDPKAHYSDNGCKSFAGNRAESFPEALAWASKRFGVKAWVNCPSDVNAKIPKRVYDKMVQALAEASCPTN
jgi:hypothetical protein